MKCNCDPKCWELAEYFLESDTDEKAVAELALAIQQAVEDHLLVTEQFLTSKGK